MNPASHSEVLYDWAIEGDSSEQDFVWTSAQLSSILAQMLRICSLAGETLATFSADVVEGQSVKVLKIALAKQIGVTRFRQRWFSKDHAELHDDSVVPCCDVQLVVMSFVEAEKEEARQLLSACRENHPDELMDLLRRPLNPEGGRERRGFLAGLHLAGQNGHSHIVQLLLEAGTDVNIADDDYDEDDVDDIYGHDYEYYYNSRTALHLAAENGHYNVVKLLLEAGANKNAAVRGGSTALHLAALMGHPEVVELLLEAGAHKDAADGGGRTALHDAAENGRLEVVKLLLEAGADKDAADHYGATALHWAADQGCSEVVKHLLRARAHKDAVDHYGVTPLKDAAASGHSEVVKLLLEAGSEKDVASKVRNGGGTALHSAAWMGHSEVVELLLEVGADKDVKDSENRLPVDLAHLRGHREVVHLLQPQTQKRRKLTH